MLNAKIGALKMLNSLNRGEINWGLTELKNWFIYLIN